MPCPICLSAPAMSMPAARQSASSAECVPDLSPREMNRALDPTDLFAPLRRERQT
jgi:hypothetical protein